MNYMLKSPIAFLNTPNIYNLTWASLPLVQTKKVDMWTSLKKYVEKYYSSKSGLELGKRCVVNLLRFQFCFSDSNVKHKGDIVSSLKCLGLLPDRLSYITSLTFSWRRSMRVSNLWIQYFLTCSLNCTREWKKLPSNMNMHMTILLYLWMSSAALKDIIKIVGNCISDVSQAQC